MADIVLAQGTNVPSSMVTRWRDMGDGTHALVIATTLADLQLDDTDKLAVSLYGTDVAAGDTPVNVSPAGNTEVDIVIALPTGTNTIGFVGSHGITISQTPTVTAGIYAANDAVGGLLTFANAARTSGDGGVIKDVIILDDAGQDAALELWLFSVTFTAMADNAPWAPSEADLRNLVAIISTGEGLWFPAGTPSAARVEVSQRYDCAATSLFGQLVTRGTPTYAATDDVTCIIGCLQD